MESNEVDGVPGLLAENLAKLPDPIAPRRSSPTGARPIVVVLGMHRSGTSLLSQVLHYLGVHMADETDHVSSRNPGGFWERPELVELQDELMAVIGRPLNSPLSYMPFPAGWWRDKPVQPIKKKLRAYLERHLAETPGWWGFKDPRTCRLLPLWWEVFDELNLAPRYVWAVRSPAEAASSMALKNPAARPMSPAQAEIVWLAYNYDILRYIGATDFVAVEYSEWFADPLAVAQRLVDHLKLPGFASQSDASDCLHRIVQPLFRHHFAEKQTGWHPSPLSMEFFRELSRMAGGGMRDERMRGYVAMLDITLKTVAPFAELLTEMLSLRERARALDDIAASLRALSLPAPQEALSETDPAYLKARVGQVADELKRLHNQLRSDGSEAVLRTTALGQRIGELKGTVADARQHVVAAEAELAGVRQAQAVTERRLGHEIEALRADSNVMATRQVALKQQIGELEAALTGARQDAALAHTGTATARQDQAAVERQLGQEITALRGNNEVMAAREVALKQRIGKFETALAEARQDAEAARTALAAARQEQAATEQKLGQQIGALRGDNDAMATKQAALASAKTRLDRRNGELEGELAQAREHDASVEAALTAALQNHAASEQRYRDEIAAVRAENAAATAKGGRWRWRKLGWSNGSAR